MLVQKKEKKVGKLHETCAKKIILVLGEKQNGRHFPAILQQFLAIFEQFVAIFNGFISNKACTSMWDKRNTWLVTDTVYFYQTRCVFRSISCSRLRLSHDIDLNTHLV